MRKLLVLAIVLAWLPVTPLFAVELKVDGDFRVRGFYNNNLTDANSSIKDENAFNSERFILNFVAKTGTGPVNVEGSTAGHGAVVSARNAVHNPFAHC